MQRWSCDQKSLLLQPGYLFEGLEVVFFRTLLVDASPRGTEEISEFDMCLYVYQFQSCHLYGELSVVSFMFLNLSLDEGDFFKDHVCTYFPVNRQVFSLALCVTVIYRETGALQSGIRLVASAANPVRASLGQVSGPSGVGVSAFTPRNWRSFDVSRI